MNAKREVLLRYSILLILAFPDLWLFYTVFTPLTITPSYYLINLFFPSQISGSMIISSYGVIELIDACIAGSAYYLLLILNLTTPLIKLRTRIKAIACSLTAFLIVNIIRIFLFSALFFRGYEFFDTAHLIVWYGVSTLLVLVIWIGEIKIFKIKAIPIYTDIRSIIKG